MQRKTIKWATRGKAKVKNRARKKARNRFAIPRFNVKTVFKTFFPDINFFANVQRS